MNFPNIIETACIPTTPVPPDARCGDPIFALLHPEICANAPFLVIKPGILVACILGSVQFRAFTVLNGMETEVTTGVSFSSSDASVALVGAISGNATGVGQGVVTITATYQGLTATASLTIMPGLNCCDATHVATMLVVDKSHSMSLQFGNGYATKQAFADFIAQQYANQLNNTKDTIGLIEFDDTNTVTETLTDDGTAVGTAAAAIINSVRKTGIAQALQEAVDQLALSSANQKVIVLITDGEDKDPDNDPVPIATAFKAAGGLLMCIGVRAHTTGFNLLTALSTGGFFVNAYPDIVEQAVQWIYGLKGYFCAGQCVPEGNTFANESALNYSGFANWDVSGHVDLFGPGLFDLLPGNGLYVNLVSNMSPYNGELTSKTNFNFIAGKTYRLSFYLAGNQRQDQGVQTVTVQIGDGTQFSHTINIGDFEQDFVKYSFNFTSLVDFSGQIILGQMGNNSMGNYYGTLMNQVTLENVTDLVTVFSDNFDAENFVYIPPACGVIDTGGPPDPGVDPDVTAFLTCSGITDPDLISAVTTLVANLKANNLWTTMDAIYPFIGGTAQAHSCNLRNPDTFNIAWTGGVTHDAFGITGDGVTGYGDTGFTGGNLTPLSALIGVYNRTANPTIGLGVMMMGVDGNNIDDIMTLAVVAPNDLSVTGLLVGNSYDAPAGDLVGNLMASKTSEHTQSILTPSGTTNMNPGTAGELPDLTLTLLAFNDDLLGPTFFYLGTLSFAFMGAGISDSQMSVLAGIITTFQTTLGRA